jgi:hypothetical protein
VSPSLTLVKAAIIGVGGTIALDAWALFAARTLRLPATRWDMVGRWLGNMPRGKFAHAKIAEAPSVPGELAIGWLAHYAIGIGYGLALLAVSGPSWLDAPTILTPLLVAWVMLVAPFFVMMPGMGSGIAASKTANPSAARLKSFVSHSVFGLGMYATAWALVRL